MSALFSYICLFVSLRPHLSSHWSPAYAVKQTPLINASALTLKQMKGETPVIFTCSQICLFILQSAAILKVLVGPEESQQTVKFIYKFITFSCWPVKLLSNMSTFVCYFTQTTRVFIKYIALCVSFFVLCSIGAALSLSRLYLRSTGSSGWRPWMAKNQWVYHHHSSLIKSLCVWSCFWSFVVSVLDLSFSDSKAGRE